jgi:hypothetical protein
MQMKAVQSFRMFGTAHPKTQRHILEDLSLQQHCHENLTFRVRLKSD